MTWIRPILLAVALVGISRGFVQAEEAPCVPSMFPLKYLCVCPSPCKKPMPNVCWDWKSTCDTYCKKPAPCVPSPCLKFLCDTYDCKSAPTCYPKPPCPVR